MAGLSTALWVCVQVAIWIPQTDSYSYWFSNMSLNCLDADLWCLTYWGGHLASLSTKAVAATVLKAKPDNSERWIGYQRDDTLSLSWHWLDGSTGSYTNWQTYFLRRNEPNDPAACACAYLGSSKSWYDQPCDTIQRPFICERVDYCSTSPCKAGSTCTNTPQGYLCTCPPGHTGSDCYLDVDECAESSRCGVGGVCTNTDSGYNCTCLPGYTGTLCQEDVDECVADPCLHNGTCVNSHGSFTCMCTTTNTGQYCETVQGDPGSAAVASHQQGNRGSLIAGVVVAALVVVILILFILVLIVCKRKRKKPSTLLKPSMAMSMDNTYSLERPTHSHNPVLELQLSRASEPRSICDSLYANSSVSSQRQPSAATSLTTLVYDTPRHSDLTHPPPHHLNNPVYDSPRHSDLTTTDRPSHDLYDTQLEPQYCNVGEIGPSGSVYCSMSPGHKIQRESSQYMDCSGVDTDTDFRRTLVDSSTAPISPTNLVLEDNVLYDAYNV